MKCKLKYIWDYFQKDKGTQYFKMSDKGFGILIKTCYYTLALNHFKNNSFCVHKIWF